MTDYATKDIERLRSKVVSSLQQQGFTIRGKRLVLPDTSDKDGIRHLHQIAVKHNRERSRRGLERHESRLLSNLASGTEVVPGKIRPRLVLVQPDSEDELLFRYVRLHWSVPVSAGYGRRLRFLVLDESNDKLIGIFGLGDPVFSLAPRDLWVGWDRETRKSRLRFVMDLFVLGSVPPYSQLLCGKLVALLTTCVDVQRAFHGRYHGRLSYIGQKTSDGQLAMLTTTSALGRSSLYNRLRIMENQVFHSVGYTRGSGDFHFSNGFYEDLRKLAVEHCDSTAKNPLWGTGFRNRRELVRKTLPLLGLSSELLYHGVKREVFTAPLATNAREFLCGYDQELSREERSVDEVFAWFRDRWLLPRALRDRRYRDFDPNTYRLWSS